MTTWAPSVVPVSGTRDNRSAKPLGLADTACVWESTSLTGVSLKSPIVEPARMTAVEPIITPAPPSRLVSCGGTPNAPATTSPEACEAMRTRSTVSGLVMISLCSLNHDAGCDSPGRPAREVLSGDRLG